MLQTIASFPPAASSEPRLSERPTIHPTAQIYQCQVGGWTEIGPGSILAESTFDDYSYAAGDLSMIYTDVGKFCSIASHVRINPGNHPMDRVTQHHCISLPGRLLTTQTTEPVAPTGCILLNTSGKRAWYSAAQVPRQFPRLLQFFVWGA